MFAIIAFICFLIALFEPIVGPVNMWILGLMFIALHLVVGGVVNVGALWNRNRT